jgi:hypothetical protein
LHHHYGRNLISDMDRRKAGYKFACSLRINVDPGATVHISRKEGLLSPARGCYRQISKPVGRLRGWTVGGAVAPDERAAMYRRCRAALSMAIWLPVWSFVAQPNGGTSFPPASCAVPGDTFRGLVPRLRRLPVRFFAMVSVAPRLRHSPGSDSAFSAQLRASCTYTTRDDTRIV